MLLFRNFLLAAAGTFGLLEMFKSEDLLNTGSDPAAMVVKAIITITVGLLSTFLTRLFRNYKSRINKTSKTRSTKNASRSHQSKK